MYILKHRIAAKFWWRLRDLWHLPHFFENYGNYPERYFSSTPIWQMKIYHRMSYLYFHCTGGCGWRTNLCDYLECNARYHVDIVDQVIWYPSN